VIHPTTPSRRVHRLSLRAPTAELAQHSAIILSDALHTASIPEADQGRLVVIRRLDLGRINPNAVSSTLALRIEQVSRSVVMNAQRADSPFAATASAVVFRDYTEAAVLLTRRVAAHQSAYEWFWQAVFPEWKSVTSQSESWKLLLDIAHKQEAPVLTVTSVVHEVLKAGACAEMAENVSEANAAVWLRQIGLGPSEKSTHSQPMEQEYQFAGPVIHAVLKSYIVKWGYRDLRSFWLTSIGMLIARPSLVIVNDLARRVRAWLDFQEELESSGVARGVSVNESDSYKSVISDTNQVTVIDEKSTQILKAETTERSTAEPLQTLEEKSLTKKEVSGQIIETNENQYTPDDTALMRSEVVDEAGEWSEFGGLFFLVPVMERLGIREFLEINPQLAQTAFPKRFLLYIGQRISLASPDPLIPVLMNEPAEIKKDPDFQLTPKLADFLSRTGKLSLYNTPQHIWLKAVRRWCRLEARMGLINLIRRKSLVLASQTHIDICFGLDQADIRLRRQALDVNPGWVPWLGYIIRFHYGETDYGF
jgi:hypothetical protein